MVEHDPKKPSKKPLIYYYFAVFMLVMLLNALIFPVLIQPEVKEVRYSTFLNMVDN